MNKNSQPETHFWKVPALDQRPVIVAVAGPNGAGKTTFYESQLKHCGLRFLNADIFAGELAIDPYLAAEIAGKLRQEFVRQQESFIFETVFSDPVGEKVTFLRKTAQAGYTVVLCFIGIASADISEQRVSIRVSRGGHDVPNDKLAARFPRTLDNLERAIRELPCVYIFDNNDLRIPYRLVAVFENGRPTFKATVVPKWLKTALGIS